MAIYWIEFKKRLSVCITLKEPDEERARKIATEYAELNKKEGEDIAITGVYGLPYPASPIILNETGWPAFCFHGSKCKDHGACPRSYACSE